MRILATPFGWIMKFCYTLFKNYGVALFLFTLVTKLLMLPSSIKQQKSSAKMAKLQPKLEQIKKKYANNRDKLNEATMELYNQEGVSPTGGCGSMIITYILLFAVIEVVYAPMSYISGLPSQKVNEAVQTVVELNQISSAVKNDHGEDRETGFTISERLEQGTDLRELLASYNVPAKDGENPPFTEERLEELAVIFEENPGLDEYFNNPKKVSARLLAGGTTRAQLIVLSIAKDYPQLFDPEVAEFCDGFNYTFCGLYLGEYPSWSTVYILIPIVSLISQLALTIVMQVFQKRNGMNVQQGRGMMGFLYAMPVISFIIAFSFPAGIGIYWIFSSVLSLAQSVALQLYFTPERLDKILAKEAKKKGRRPSLYQLALEQQKAQQGSNSGSLLDDLDDAEVKLSKNERKEIERLKINEARKRLADDDEDEDPRVVEARKRMAEKYGDGSPE